MNIGAISNELITLHPLKYEDYDLVFEVASDASIWAQHPDTNR